MKILTNDKGESPLEVMFVVMFAIITLTFVAFIAGIYIDNFMAIISGVDIPLSGWGSKMMDLLPNKYAKWVFYVPPFFALVIMVWAIKTVIKKHRYTSQDTQYMADDGF